jgi:CheY-like chemotaxis protein
VPTPRRWSRPNRALESSRARAEAALQTKSECLASLSQEIRTPLLAILGYAELLRDDVRSDGALRSEHADMIHGHGESLLTTLSDLFDLSCIETQRLVLTRSAFSPQALVDEVLGSVAAQARAQSLELGSEWLTPAPQTIESDPARLRQVLHHLVENAVKFTAHGSVRVRLALESRPGEEALLRIAVADTGEGLPPELHGRLFEAFTTQVGQHVRERGGAGLGLALSKRLAQLLGGDLTAESAPGSGCTFTLTVKAGTPGPIVEALQPRAPIPAPAPKPEPDLPVLAGGRILLIEDVAATQKLFRHFLEAAGAEVESAGDGRSGVDVALAAEQRGQGFDIVLMDIHLPILDGHAAAKELRQRGFQGAIVAVTASALSGDREACLAAGCDDYASKPLGRRALIELCASWVRAGEQRRARKPV